MGYLGCGTALNKVLWGVFAGLLLLGAVLVAVGGAKLGPCRAALEACKVQVGGRPPALCGGAAAAVGRARPHPTPRTHTNTPHAPRTRGRPTARARRPTLSVLRASASARAATWSRAPWACCASWAAVCWCAACAAARRRR
jgi:hypothetical protein